MLNSEQRRLHSVRNRSAKADIETHTEWLKERVKGLDGEIDQLRQDIAQRQQQYEWLTSVPGVGRVVRTTLLAALRELGWISSKQLASLGRFVQAHGQKTQAQMSDSTPSSWDITPLA